MPFSIAFIRRSIIGLVLLALASPAAWADPPPANESPAPENKPAEAAKPEVNTKEAAERLKAANKAVDTGDYPQAITDLQASVKANPTAKAYLMLGNVYVKTGQFEEAKVAFEEYLKRDPKSRSRKIIQRLIEQIGAVAKTRFRIESEPPGATIYIDLKAAGAYGVTPKVLPVASGRHRVILELADHEPAVVPGAVALDDQEVPIKVTLKLKGCDVALAVAPASTTMQVDGAPAISTPETLRVRPGKHTLAFASQGFVAQTRTVECQGYQPLRVEEQLVASIGTLRVRVPRKAQVTVDGKTYSRSEAEALTLPPGEHQVGVTAPDKLPWQGKATVRLGEETKLEPALVAAPVAVTAQSKPVYKKAWFWGVIGGVAAAGAGVGIGLGVAQSSSSSSDNFGADSFGKFSASLWSF